MTINVEELFVTTVDNPFDPFTQFDDWYSFDCGKQYFTCSLIDRIVQTNNEKVLSNHSTLDDYNRACKDVVSLNPELYRIVRNPSTVEEYEVD